MKLLLDTRVLLWWLADAPELGGPAREAIASPQSLVLVSAATVWEIGIKAALGKLRAPEGIPDLIEDEGFRGLPIALEDAEAAARLPAHHRDPFDRMLVAQAMAHGLTLVTADRRLEPYGARLLRA